MAGSPAPLILKQLTLPPGVDSLVLLRERGLGVGVRTSATREKALPNNSQLAELETAVEEPKVTVIAQEPEEFDKKPEDKEQWQKSTASVCFTLGPFAQSDVANRAADKISGLGLRVEHRQESQRTPKGYWVYLPPSKSYQAAKRKVSEMQKRGVNDLFIMGKGTRKHAISLGLFNRKQAAQGRFQQVKKLGLKPVFETQYRVSKQFWLDMSVAGDQTATVATLTELIEGFSKTSLTQRKCQ